MNKEKLYLSTIDPTAANLARIHGLGLEIAEFCTAWNLDQCFSSTDSTVRSEMEGLSRFTMHGPYNELYPCAIDPKARGLCRDRFLQAMETAERYGIHKLILHGGFDDHLYFPVWFREQSILFWKDLVSQIPEDMTVCLENVLEKEPGYLTEILACVDDHRLRMCLDVGHAQVYSHCTPVQWIQQAHPFISHFHIHNNDGRQDSHSPLTEGVIPMETLFEAIEQHCCQATLTLELPEAASSLVWLKEHHILEEES